MCMHAMIGHIFVSLRRNAEVEAHIAALRAELLHKEQENERVQLQLAKEKEERERAERQVKADSAGHCWRTCCT